MVGKLGFPGESGRDQTMARQRYQTGRSAGCRKQDRMWPARPMPSAGRFAKAFTMAPVMALAMPWWRRACRRGTAADAARSARPAPAGRLPGRGLAGFPRPPLERTDPVASARRRAAAPRRAGGLPAGHRAQGAVGAPRWPGGARPGGAEPVADLPARVAYGISDSGPSCCRCWTRSISGPSATRHSRCGRHGRAGRWRPGRHQAGPADRVDRADRTARAEARISGVPPCIGLQAVAPAG